MLRSLCIDDVGGLLYGYKSTSCKRVGMCYWYVLLVCATGIAAEVDVFAVLLLAAVSVSSSHALAATAGIDTGAVHHLAVGVVLVAAVVVVVVGATGVWMGLASCSQQQREVQGGRKQAQACQ